ncbi:hypothetical protein EDB80DRAFT_676348 [Ilyonectria destructans]|nr:hypothetical protein EDB80DRAFT_676348 [Ilyonectria destructans]
MPYYFRPPHGSHLTRPHLGNGIPPGRPLGKEHENLGNSRLDPPSPGHIVHSPALSRNANSSHMTSRFTFTLVRNPVNLWSRFGEEKKNQVKSNLKLKRNTQNTMFKYTPSSPISRLPGIHPRVKAVIQSRPSKQGCATIMQGQKQTPFGTHSPEDKRRPETTVTYCASARRDGACRRPARHSDFTRACPFVVQGSVSFTFW